MSIVNAVLYSDQVIAANAKVDQHLLKLLGPARRRIGYIPSGPDPARVFFNEKRSYYAQYGLELSLFHDLDIAGHPSELFACDAIHLSGGNTTGFLARLRCSGLLEPLKDWAARGGILIGTSAGAILMTPTIAVDALFSDQRPETVAEPEALDLLPFEFFPHFDDRYVPELLRYSRLTPRPIIGCADGEGIVVRAGKITPVGHLVRISQGTVSHIPTDQPIKLADLSN